jgi:5-methylcytosine-specific restriction endonuclease McrA
MQRVLLLNASYEPLAVVSARRALRLLFAGKADVVIESAGRFHSPSVTVVVPSVIRLVRYVVVPYGRSAPVNTRNVLARDHHTCAYCGRVATTTDHVVPRCRGGRHAWENVVAACAKCNHRKGDRLLAELGWALHRMPFRPKGCAAWLLSVTPEPGWAPYLELVS